jgi:hypothetical protein
VLAGAQCDDRRQHTPNDEDRERYDPDHGRSTCAAKHMLSISGIPMPLPWSRQG